MATKSTNNEIDVQIAQLSPAVRAILQKIRTIARNATPEAEEIIGCRMSALRMNGILVCFTAFKKHMGMDPPISGDKATEKGDCTLRRSGSLRLRELDFRLIDSMLELFNDRGNLTLRESLVDVLRAVDIPGFNLEPDGTLDLAGIGRIRQFFDGSQTVSLCASRALDSW